MKNFKSTAWILPQPVLIIGTYDKNGKPNAMNAADESETGYYLVAEIVNILCDEKYLAEDGKPDVEKMDLITFDPVHHTYIQLGKTVGNAFSDGKQLK